MSEMGSKYQRHLSAAPLAGVPVAPAVDGETAGDLAEKGCENGRAAGRHGVPCREIGVIHAFLGVFVVCQDVFGNRKAVAAVFLRGFGNGGFRPRPIQRDDVLIVQSKHLLVSV